MDIKGYARFAEEIAIGLKSHAWKPRRKKEPLTRNSGNSLHRSDASEAKVFRLYIFLNALGGTFFEPMIIADASQDMLAAHEETFGPLAPLIRFETEDQAIAIANDTEFGLAAYFYARDIGRIRRLAEGIEAGLVGINTLPFSFVLGRRQYRRECLLADWAFSQKNLASPNASEAAAMHPFFVDTQCPNQAARGSR